MLDRIEWDFGSGVWCLCFCHFILLQDRSVSERESKKREVYIRTHWGYNSKFLFCSFTFFFFFFILVIILFFYLACQEITEKIGTGNDNVLLLNRKRQPIGEKEKTIYYHIYNIYSFLS